MEVDSVAISGFVALVAAIILHEISHGVVALWFGDDTARRAGRLTLNPVPHIDAFGSIIIPALGWLTGIGVIGWAKPVPVNPNRLRNRRRDMLFVSLAGPTTNFALMAFSAVVTRMMISGHSYATVGDLPGPALAAFLFAFVNLFLGLFNLLPIPPLDGSALLERVLPAAWLPAWYRFRPYGMLVLIVVVFSTGIVGDVIRPFERRLLDFVSG